MHYSPMGAILAERLTDAEVNSALPNAPVVPERPPRAPRTRAALARTLHRLAARLEPEPLCVPAPFAG